jgi:hypothetical protein
MPDDAVRAVAELAASQHRAFTRNQAAALDFDYRRIATGKRAGWLAEPVSGVLTIAGSKPTWQQRLMVVVLATGGHGVASHRAAARLHKLDGFDYPGMAVVEASVTRAFRHQFPDAVIHHITPLDPCDVTTVDGIACTTIPRTLADLGSVIRDRRRVGRALTDVRRRHFDVLALRATAERLHRPGQAGTGTLLRLLDTIPFEGQVPATWFEELLSLCLADPTLPEIVLQCPIRNEDGRVVARADIGMPEIRLGLEAHSRRFHWGPIFQPLDEDRDIAAALCGWELTYVGWYATKRPAEVLRIVKELVRARKCVLTQRTSAV